MKNVVKTFIVFFVIAAATHAFALDGVYLKIMAASGIFPPEHKGEPGPKGEIIWRKTLTPGNYELSFTDKSGTAVVCVGKPKQANNNTAAPDSVAAQTSSEDTPANYKKVEVTLTMTPRGASSGKQADKPIVVTKLIDKASPVSLSITVPENGDYELRFLCKLDDGTIASIESWQTKPH